MECKECGAKYKIEMQEYPIRDKDSIICQYCGTLLKKWNAAVLYSIEYISGPTIEKYIALKDIGDA